MCGIFGTVNYNGPIKHLISALNSLSHRGPDTYNFTRNGTTFTGHRRLSILDLDPRATQPFTSVQHKINVTVNGEIYNYQDLREDLIKHYEFQSESDSEVVLWGYIHWGIDVLLQKLRGMYAIAISSPDKLILATDRYGKKPIFTLKKDSYFAYASEAKAFSHLKGHRLRLSKQKVFRWMNERGLRSGNTIFAEIDRLKPASILEITTSSLDISERTYFNNQDTFDKSVLKTRNFDELFLDAVETRLNADVSIGLQLSGGVDSSLVAWAIAELGRNIDTYSIGFSDERFKQKSEEKFARNVAEKWGFDHFQINLDSTQLLSKLRDAIFAFDGMLEFPNAIPLMFLNEFSSKRVKVMLTGDGSDETFGGYVKFSRAAALYDKKPYVNLPDSLLRYSPRMVQRKLNALNHCSEIHNAPHKFLYSLNSFLMEGTTCFFGDTYGNRNISNSNLNFHDALLLNDQNGYLTSMFDRQDRTCSFYGMEARSPFVDEDLIAFANSLDFSEKFDPSNQKKIIKKLCSRIYGEEFTYRRKTGFPMPLKIWLENPSELSDALAEVTGGNSPINDIFPANKLNDFLKRPRNRYGLKNYGDDQDLHFKWYLAVLHLACEVFQICEISE